MSRPDRADLARSAIANSDDKIHLRSVWLAKNFPALTREPLGGDPGVFKGDQGERIGLLIFSRSAAGRVRFEPAAAYVIQECLSEDAASGVVRTKKQNIEWRGMFIHESAP